MSYFVTFYSYKGGVGRTLALANVAWLLANHKTEPARVLAIDFDLGAPGLSQVFGIRRTRKCPGVVDYVTEYLANAVIPDVTKFIHKTSFVNIDLLPAGLFDSAYQRRLETIDWKGMYEGAFGYELIERLKADISAISPEYDYVLVDSLTGYSDVGGICVNQFPDTLILLFRLNQQNLDGIGTVVRALAPRTDEEPSRSVVPVISPSWPFLDEAAGKWIKRAERLFPENKLFELSFDSSLSYGERIISEIATDLPFASKVFADYKKLTDQIRESNSSDPLTLWDNLRPSGPMESEESAELLLKLLARRRSVLEYWLSLPIAFGYPWPDRSDQPRSKTLEKLIAFVDQEVDAGNKNALVARARIRQFTENENPRSASKEDLNRALEIDPNFFEALSDRARLSSLCHEYEDAIADFKACLKLRPEGDSHVEYLLAQVYLKLFRAQEALDAIEAAIAHGRKTQDSYSIKARALYLLGNYSEALTDARTAAKLGSLGASPSFMPSQILAAMGQIDEATKELAKLSERIGADSRDNLAEAYLAVDPKMTINLLSTKTKTQDPDAAVRKLLLTLARILRGGDLAPIAAEVDKPIDKHISRNRWDAFEVVAMLRAKQRASAISREALELASRAISKAMNAKGLAAIRSE